MSHLFLRRFFNINTSKKFIFSANVSYRKKNKVYYEKKKDIKDPTVSSSLKATQDSLSSRGYLRAYKPYNPPQNVEQLIKSICNETIECSSFDPAYLMNNLEKFNILNKCFKKLNHSVPNSILYKVRNLGDVVEFYKTSVETKNPLEAMKDLELPPNLHILYEPERFHPETDTKFGISAYPSRSTIVTGLKYKKKYKGYTAEQPWNTVYKD